MTDLVVPPVDRRTAREVEAELRALLAVYVPEWRGGTQDAGDALVGVFARLAELLIQRLNRAPAKNQLAFLDLLGQALLPPQPARVPLTFALAPGSRRDALVPAGTPVAAPPAPGSSEPVVFETDRDLLVGTTTLAGAFVREPAADRWADLGPRLLGAATASASIFEGDTPTSHLWAVAHGALFARGDLDEWRLRIDVAPATAPPDAASVRWETAGGEPLAVLADDTAGLSRSGTVVLRATGPLAPAAFGGAVDRWVCARLLTPISPGEQALAGRARAARLPTLAGVALHGRRRQRDLAPQAAFANNRPLDADAAWPPFGDRPAFGDALYLASDEAFTHAGAALTLHVRLANPRGAAAPPPLRPAEGSSDLALAWECWDGRAWTPVLQLVDGTDRLTKDGDVLLVLPATQPRSVHGQPAHWLRVRLAGGHYGLPETFGPVPAPSSLAPPLIAALRIDVEATLPEVAPQALRAVDDFQVRAAGTLPFQPFVPMRDERPQFLVALRPPEGATGFASVPVTLYADAPPLPFGRPPDNPAAARPARTAWEYWDGLAWQPLAVRDESAGASQAGTLDFIVPADLALRPDLGLEGCGWLRLRWLEGDFRFLPVLQQMLMHTTMATQAVTVRDEVLGSSDGSPGQRFRLARHPVLGGERLAVAGDDGGTPWTAVPDFHASGPLDRHYTIERVQGELRFGDGRRGRIPPPGAGNVRMAFYRTGGGRAGNVPAGSATGLQTAIASIDAVQQRCPAAGGADAEDLAAFLDRAPRSIRHHGRAVTLADYEDLACEASAEVARAKAWDLVDLALDPDGRDARTGHVSVVIVPAGDGPRPQPSLALLQRVRAALDAARSPLAALSLVGPDYVRVDVEIDVVPASASAAATLEAALRAALARFLHPLSGGLDGRGWPFGRRPHRSDLFALAGRVAGVDHVRRLQVTEHEDRLGAAAGGRFLVHSGHHRVTLVPRAS